MAGAACLNMSEPCAVSPTCCFHRCVTLCTSEACSNPPRQNHGFGLACCVVLSLSNTERLQNRALSIEVPVVQFVSLLVRDARENGESQQRLARVVSLLLGSLGPCTMSLQDGRVNFADFVNLLK